MKVIRKILTALALIFGASAHLSADIFSDIEKEKRWAQQVIDTLFDGEPVWLQAADHEFLALEMEASEGDTGRAAIVIHGIGIHPNWDTVIRPLRVGLTEHGWHTLSIQMPILPNEAESHEYAPLLDEVADRINAAIGHLQANGHQKLVIIAHSLGATMTMRYMEDVPKPPLEALVLIGMQGGPDSVHDNAATLKTIKQLPVLDLYGSGDLPGVVDFTGRKADAASGAGNQGFQQLMVDGADHFFQGLDEILVETVSDWLTKTI